MPKKVRCTVRGVRHFFYICNYEYRMRLGIAKSEMGFPLVFALAFRYLCKLYVYDSYNIDEWKSSEFNEI